MNTRAHEFGATGSAYAGRAAWLPNAVEHRRLARRVVDHGLFCAAAARLGGHRWRLPAAKQRFLLSRATHSRRRDRQPRVLPVRRPPARPGRHVDPVAVGVRLSDGEGYAARSVVRADTRSDGVHRLCAGRLDLRQRGVVHGGNRRDRSGPRAPTARDAVLRAVAADAAPACHRHDRSPLRRAHVRAAQRMARPVVVQATGRAAPSRRVGRRARPRAGVSQRTIHLAARAVGLRVRALVTRAALPRSGRARLRHRVAR